MYVKFDPIKDEPGASYFMRQYGTCVAKPNGSGDCGSDCMKCFGANWRPHGVKSHADLRQWHAKRLGLQGRPVDREVAEPEGDGRVQEPDVLAGGPELKSL